ncbi:hypothetical protein L208DRAFT_1013920, partial [Tricholoma matsutake]
IIVLMIDNVTNNNILTLRIKRCSKEAGYHFSAMDSCMCCMPHTVHLAAIKLLKGIGAISKADSKKAKSHSGNYQGNAIAPVDHEFDNEAVQQEDEADEDKDEDEDEDESHATSLMRFYLLVRSSPQHHQNWYKEIYVTINQGIAGDDTESAALMLILDVRIWWSSTHQML